MKILFSPSESKVANGIFTPFKKSNFIFERLYDERILVLNKYSEFVKNATSDKLTVLFGTKNHDHIQAYKKDIFTAPTLKAIQRYNGVAFDALDYENLNKASQEYIDQNVMIFSNLFGAISAKDHIPNYKLKQGQTIAGFAPENHYRNTFKNTLDEYFNGEEILDLRAKFYEKFYQIEKPYITMKFQKNRKIISHFAKYYRGKILKFIAQNRLESARAITEHNYENLEIVDIKIVKNKTEITYEILDI